MTKRKVKKNSLKPLSYYPKYLRSAIKEDREYRKRKYGSSKILR